MLDFSDHEHSPFCGGGGGGGGGGGMFVLYVVCILYVVCYQEIIYNFFALPPKPYMEREVVLRFFWV